MAGGGGGSGSYSGKNRRVRQPGSGTEGGVGIGETSAELNCEGFDEITILQSPDKDVVQDLVVGDSLDVEPSDEQPGAIVLKDSKGRIAGAVLPSDIITLIDCLNLGKLFSAIVVGINGGRIQVRIQGR